MSTVINHANPEMLTIDVVARQYTGAAENAYIPEGVTALDQWTFWFDDDNNSTIKRLRIPNSMARIFGNSFNRCYELEELFIPASVEEIVPAGGSNDFWRNKYRPFKQMYVEPNSYAEAFAIENKIPYSYFDTADVVWDVESKDVWKISKTLTAVAKGEKEIIIPEGVTGIANDVFRNNEEIEIILVPKCLERIDGEFRDCINLRNIIGLEETKIESLHSGMFYGCASLEKIALPKTIKEIGASAFWGCKMLKELVIPDGCCEIGNYALCASELEKIVIPASVTEIGVDILPPPNKDLCIWGKEGSAIARVARRGGYRFEQIDAVDQAPNLLSADFDERSEMFTKLFRKISGELYESEYCYVHEARMEDYQISSTSDFDAASHMLAMYFDVENIWRAFQHHGDLNLLYELHGLHAIAIALAIKVYICSSVNIKLGFETSKWNSGQVDCWWVLSHSEPDGELIR